MTTTETAEARARIERQIDVKAERAAFEAWWRNWCPDREVPAASSHVMDAWLARARCRSASLTPTTQGGEWRWVPVEPTKEMLQAGMKQAEDCLDEDMESSPNGSAVYTITSLRSDAPFSIYKAMLSAIPNASPGDAPKRTMTVDLSEREQEALQRLMDEQELSDVQVFRQALKGYQLDHERRKAGETVTWSGDAQRARDFAGPLASAPTAERLRSALDGWFVSFEADAHGRWHISHRGKRIEYVETCRDDAHERMKDLRFAMVCAALSDAGEERA